jgi:hypothetical protein
MTINFFLLTLQDHTKILNPDFTAKAKANSPTARILMAELYQYGKHLPLAYLSIP